MQPEERRRKIESYGNAYELLVNALQEFPSEMWQYRSAPDCWTIHEIIVHITDSEANSYIRCRRLIAEPGTTLMAYDENQWAVALDYHSQSTQDALELFKWLRLKSYKLVKALPDLTWSHKVHHPESGSMTLDDWLDTYERHVPIHIEQMQAVYKAWRAM